MNQLAELEQLVELPQKLKQQSTCGYKRHWNGTRLLVENNSCGFRGHADKLSELNVTEASIDELDDFVLDDKVNNQLRGGSSSSLRTWNQNIVINQLGYLCFLRRWINNQPAKLEKLDVAEVDKAGKLHELAVTDEAFNELNELVVDEEAF